MNFKQELLPVALNRGKRKLFSFKCNYEFQAGIVTSKMVRNKHFYVFIWIHSTFQYFVFVLICDCMNLDLGSYISVMHFVSLLRQVRIFQEAIYAYCLEHVQYFRVEKCIAKILWPYPIVGKVTFILYPKATRKQANSILYLP